MGKYRDGRRGLKFAKNFIGFQARQLIQQFVQSAFLFFARIVNLKDGS
jgi:hypothetical protein